MYKRQLKECLEEGLQNNYSLRIIHNEEQISKNNATLGNAGYLPTLDFSAGYTGNLDNIETKARATGEITKNNGVYDQTVNVGLNLNWTIFDGFNISTTYKQLKELELSLIHIVQIYDRQSGSVRLVYQSIKILIHPDRNN